MSENKFISEQIGEEPNVYDTIIIGSGPAGLSAAVYAKRAELDFIVVEKEHGISGQITESECVDNYLGLYGENGYELGEKFKSHAEALGVEFRIGELTEIIPENNIYKLLVSDKELYSKTVIYAAGAVHKKLNVKGEAEFTGKGVSYCAICDGAFYKNASVAVIGGGDTALSEAVYLSSISDKVYLVHRRNEFRANKALQERVRSKDNITVLLNASVEEITGGETVEELKITQNGEKKSLKAEGIFIAVGTVPESAALKGIAQLTPNGYVAAGENCTTTANGVFAAGDVRTKFLRQAITAAADGANAVYSVEKYLTELGYLN